MIRSCAPGWPGVQHSGLIIQNWIKKGKTLLVLRRRLCTPGAVCASSSAVISCFLLRSPRIPDWPRTWPPIARWTRSEKPRFYLKLQWRLHGHVLAWALFFPRLIIVLSVTREASDAKWWRTSKYLPPLRRENQFGHFLMLSMAQTEIFLGNTLNITKQR